MTQHQKIALPGCGCDDISQPGLLPVQTALAQLLAQARPVAGSLRCALEDLQGRVLAAPVCARGMMPPFDNSAMDGYALRLADLAAAPEGWLPVTQRIAAGSGAPDPLAPGGAARIFTGAPLPKGADAVVMQEQVTREGDQIRLRAAPEPGQNIRRAGEDLAAGAEILPAGRRISTREIAAIAGAGHDGAEVKPRLRVAVLCTGDELARAGAALEPGQIFDVNGPMLRAAVVAQGAELIAAGPCPDTPEALCAALRRLADQADVIVTSGGASVGEEDHLHAALRAAGGRLHFAGVAIKPGKPLALGQLDRTLVLGLPGNPFAAFVTWQLFGVPLVAQCAGITAPGPMSRQVVAGSPLHHRTGRCEYRPATVIGRDPAGRDLIQLAPAVHSGQLLPLAGCDGLVRLPGDQAQIPLGQMLDFIPLEG